MQEYFGTPDDFLRRTDALAVRMGLNIEDLPGILGMGRASLFSYRSGGRPISGKAWAKLNAAEEAAGGKNRTDGTDWTDEGMGGVVREDVAPYRVAAGKSHEERLAALEVALASMAKQFEAMAAAIKRAL